MMTLKLVEHIFFEIRILIGTFKQKDVGDKIWNTIALAHDRKTVAIARRKTLYGRNS